jgi:hypothetical protein
MEIIDRLSAGNPEKKRYYINLFLEVLKPEYERMRSAEMVDSDDQEPLRQILHKIKSQVQTVGANEIHAAMHAAEVKITSGGYVSGEEMAPIIAGLHALIGNLQEQL